MTGPQFKAWRIAEDLTLQEVADIRLKKQVSQSTLSRWEQSDEPMPEWASDMLLNSTRLTLPLSDLHHLLDHCRDHGLAFSDLVAQAIREYLARQQTQAHHHTDRTALVTTLLAETPTPYGLTTHPQPKTASNAPAQQPAPQAAPEATDTAHLADLDAVGNALEAELHHAPESHTPSKSPDAKPAK